MNWYKVETLENAVSTVPDGVVVGPGVRLRFPTVEEASRWATRLNEVYRAGQESVKGSSQLADKIAAADGRIDAKALDPLLADMGLPENDADLEEAAAIAREQDAQHRRTVAATYQRLQNKSPLGGHVDEEA